MSVFASHVVVTMSSHTEFPTVLYFSTVARLVALLPHLLSKVRLLSGGRARTGRRRRGASCNLGVRLPPLGPWPRPLGHDRRPGRDLVTPDRTTTTGLGCIVPGRCVLVVAGVANASWSRCLTASLLLF
ncbi:hypothetical protein Taro_002442 [Colocasia esculenta]|uniref:Uncharacterized protein n=1 Tax=Colocasia esculenta TaxID=4460 RepID=A0A843TKY1_COLES|nr:hypothetical protein [Colocasia esculenta]